jgi:hypothetical protein
MDDLQAEVLAGTKATDIKKKYKKQAEELNIELDDQIAFFESYSLPSKSTKVLIGHASVDQRGISDKSSS